MPGGQILRLKPCVSFVRSSRRLNSTFEVPKGDQLGPVQEQNHRTLRVRKDGKKPLPLPPLLDPVVIEERGRWQQPKAKPDVNKFTPFQKKLWQTSYAHALASPVRQCRFTGCLLPSDLLLSFTPQVHPESKDLWLLPVSLTASAPKQLGASLKIIVRKPIVDQLAIRKTWISHLDRRVADKVGQQGAHKMIWREDMPDLVLLMMRKTLLNKLRWHFKHSGQLVPCKSPRAEDIGDVEDVSCVLLFGSLKTIADEMQEIAQDIATTTESLANSVAEAMKSLDPHKAKGATHNPPHWWNGPLVPHLQPRVVFPPLEFKTTEWRGSRVAVYSLHDLLGEEKAEELVQELKYEGKTTCLAMPRARHNVPIELLLMRMQAYLAVPGP